MPYVHNEIKKDYLILCEGTDTEGFIINYLNSPCLKYDSRFRNDIQTFNIGGINDLSRFIRTLKNMERFEDIKQLLVIRDAETDVQSAIRSVKKSFEDNNLPIPDDCNQWKANVECGLKTCFTLLPNCNNSPIPGALEDLCWTILKKDASKEMKQDVKDFVKQIIEKYDSIGPHVHKSRLHTFFSINKDYISFKIGEAAKAGVFNWEDEHLASLRELIASGF